MKILCVTILVILFFPCFSLSQTTEGKDSIPQSRIMDINPQIMSYNGDTWLQSGICKPLRRQRLEAGAGMPSAGSGTKSHFIDMQGNIEYDYLYRSFADTPFYQKDFQQHTIRTSMNITVKDKYPFHANFVIRKSNSPYFRNFFDGGLVYDRYSYNRNIKQQLFDRIMQQLPGQPYLDNVNIQLQKEIKKFNLLKDQLSSNGLTQQLIEEKEKKYFASLKLPHAELPGYNAGKIDSLTGRFDSLKTSLEERVDVKKKELDSLQDKIASLQNKADSIRNKIAGTIALVRNKINMASDPAALAKIAGEYGVDEKKGRFEKFISGIRSVGIGRSVLNYSELTAQNVSLTGINLEYNSGIYAAVAAGKIDYGFRDFFGGNSRRNDQQLLMGRIGVGNVDKLAVILTAYTGRKLNYGSVISDTVQGSVLVTGYSIETIIKKDEHTGFSAEIAKSTRPVTGSYAQNKELGNLFHFSDESNLAVSVKGQTIIPLTNTRVSGMFRKSGENFQSFSLFSYNTDQVAWMLKAEQSLFRNKLSIAGMVRRNDFVNPFTEKTFKTSTVFGSVQASLRIHHWPTLSISYSPGSQLYIIDRDRIRENVYYIFNGTIVYPYKLWDLQMVSSAIYSSYLNKGTDSGFINYSGRNYMLSQTVYFRKLQLQGSFIYTDQQELHFYTGEGSADYTIIPVLRIGGGIKYNKVISGGTYWGNMGRLLLDIKKVGSLQLQYEKSYLPTIQQTLFPVQIGSATLIKNF